MSRNPILLAYCVAEDARHAIKPSSPIEEVAAGLAAALDAMADKIDNGPTFPLPPSVISALVREQAEDLREFRDE